jgi:hypothetical protein
VRGESSESLGIKTPKGEWIVINDESEFELLTILTVGELMELLQQCNPSSHVTLSLLDGNKDWIWLGALSEQPPWFNQGEERFGEIALHGYHIFASVRNGRQRRVPKASLRFRCALSFTHSGPQQSEVANIRMKRFVEKSKSFCIRGVSWSIDSRVVCREARTAADA